MEPDESTCETGACIINDDGVCWCGQTWNNPESPADGYDHDGDAFDSPTDEL